MKIRSIFFEQDAGGTTWGNGEDEFIDFEKMNTVLQTWEGYYDEFYKAFNDIDIEVSKTVNVSPQSCIFGDLGSSIYSAWEEKCLPWKQVYFVLRKMSATVIENIQLYKGYQEYMNDHDDSTKIDGTDITREVDPTKNDAENARTLAAITEGMTTVDGKPIAISEDGKVTIDGQEYTVTTDKDGRVTEVITPDGKKITPESVVPEGYGDSGATVKSTEDCGTSLVTPDYPTTKPIDTDKSGDTAAAELWASASQTRDSVNETISVLEDVLWQMGVNPDCPTMFYSEADDVTRQVIDTYQQYQSIAYTLDGELASGIGEWDGAFTTALPTGKNNGEVDGVQVPKNGAIGGDQGAFEAAQKKGNSINEQIAATPSLSDLDGMLTDAGYPPLADIAASSEYSDYY